MDTEQGSETEKTVFSGPVVDARKVNWYSHKFTKNQPTNQTKDPPKSKPIDILLSKKILFIFLSFVSLEHLMDRIFLSIKKDNR